MLFLLLMAAPMLAQEFDENFEIMLFEVNRGRYDKALIQTFPVQSAIRERIGGVYPRMDPGLMARMREMDDTSAVLSTIALVRSQIASKNYQEASLHSMLLGFGLSGLWAKVPPYQKLNFAKQDVKEAQPTQRSKLLKQLGYAAVDALEWDTAKKAAGELIPLVENKDFVGLDPGTLKHSALTIRGLAELGSGDLVSAEKTLVESMKVRGEIMMRETGPNFRLAKELLAKGRKQAVDQFLGLVVESAWKDSSKAEQWRRELAAGKNPDFPSFSPN